MIEMNRDKAFQNYMEGREYYNFIGLKSLEPSTKSN